MLVFFCSIGYGQRVYKSNSVLATGEWFKIAVKESGIYKVDLALMGSLGINSQNISSAAIRLFGNPGFGWRRRVI
jgi:hypothetical protein